MRSSCVDKTSANFRDRNLNLSLLEPLQSYVASSDKNPSFVRTFISDDSGEARINITYKQVGA